MHSQFLNKDKEKYSNVLRRLRLKRQTKLLSSLDEKWNNYESLNKLFHLGIDGIELFSELDYTRRSELIYKIRTIAKENNQHIPIIHNLSYFKILIKNIFSYNNNNKIGLHENDLYENSEINLNENQYIYIFKSLSEINHHVSCNNVNYKSRDFFEGEDKQQRISSNSLSFNLQEKNEYKNLVSMCILDEGSNKELSNVFKEKIDFNLNHQDNDMNEQMELANILTNEFLINKSKVLICTDPPLKYINFENGDLIHLNFGDITLVVEEIGNSYLKCKSLNNGVVKIGCAFSVEGKDHFSMNLIENDESKFLREIKESVELDFDFLVISIIDDPNEEIKKIKDVLTEYNSRIKIIVKIDNPNSINLFDSFVENTDAICFSRDDLNIKDCLAKICYNQKNIVSKCGSLGIPVIISGTFLETMRHIPNPIRSEISDLYNTILLGIDCLLITSEIIAGAYPLETIETINEICSCCEKRVDYSNLFLEVLYKTKKPMKIVEAVASSTVKTSFNLQTPYIVCLTEKGTAAICVSKYRPFCPVISYTSKVNIASQLSIFRGLFSFIFKEIWDIDSVIVHANEFLLKNKLLPLNTNIVLLSGINETKSGTTDQMRVINVGEHIN